MTPQQRPGDRRHHLRFDISGQLWASFELREPAILRNIAPGGALIETTMGPAMRGVRAAQVCFPEGGPELTAVIRHMRPSPDDDTQYLVGLEFVNLSSADRVAVEQFVRQWQQRDAV